MAWPGLAYDCTGTSSGCACQPSPDDGIQYSEAGVDLSICAAFVTTSITPLLTYQIDRPPTSRKSRSPRENAPVGDEAYSQSGQRELTDSSDYAFRDQDMQEICTIYWDFEGLHLIHATARDTFIFFTLQATADTVARHERFSGTSPDYIKRREEHITHPGLIQPKSNDSTLYGSTHSISTTHQPQMLTSHPNSIPLTITLASAPSTNLTVIHAPHALTISPSIPNVPPITHRIICPQTPSPSPRNATPNARAPPSPGAASATPTARSRPASPTRSSTALGKGAGVTGSGGVLGVDGLRGGGGEEVGAGGSEREVTRTIQSAVEVPRGRGYAVKIALRGDDGAKEVRAQSLSFKALVEGDRLQGGLWQAPKAISQRCGNCTQIGLASVPAQTGRLSAEVHLDRDLGSVKMYVVAVEV
ncbi:hypothetical protein G7Y79_00002g004880 [Physcia stellaris]|nr:hypothetical protein G7Y79_00002g004880 [Physcia stellaris]